MLESISRPNSINRRDSISRPDSYTEEAAGSSEPWDANSTIQSHVSLLETDDMRPSVGGTPEYIRDLLSAMAEIEAQRDRLEEDLNAAESQIEAERAAAVKREARLKPESLGRLSLSELRCVEDELDVATKAVREAVMLKRIAEAAQIAAQAVSNSASGASEQGTSPCCSICLERPRNIVFNCGHQSCGQCGANLPACPFCRVAISARIKMFDV